jgi:hypothetical protein
MDRSGPYSLPACVLGLCVLDQFGRLVRGATSPSLAVCLVQENRIVTNFLVVALHPSATGSIATTTLPDARTTSSRCPPGQYNSTAIKNKKKPAARTQLMVGKARSLDRAR